MVNLLPCLSRICKRPEEAVQETLASAMAKLSPVLMGFTTDSDIKVMRLHTIFLIYDYRKSQKLPFYTAKLGLKCNKSNMAIAALKEPFESCFMLLCWLLKIFKTRYWPPISPMILILVNVIIDACFRSFWSLFCLTLGLIMLHVVGLLRFVLA